MWRAIYELFLYTKYISNNLLKGTDALEELVQLAEDETQKQKPAIMRKRTHDALYGPVEGIENKRRKRRKSAAIYPITFQLCCIKEHDNCCNVLSYSACHSTLKFPMPLDKAPESYCNWLCDQVTSTKWQDSYILASEVVISEGYHLGLIDKKQNENIKILVAAGVLRGIATQFVSRIREWLNELENSKLES